MLSGRTLVVGAAQGIVTVLEEPLSFWGGVDPSTGRIIDQRHPQAGAELAGRILVMPSGRGSSSSSSVLAETVRRGTAPAGIVLRAVDEILLVGALVARELYGTAPPVVILQSDQYDELMGEDTARIDAGKQSAHVHYQRKTGDGGPSWRT